MNLKQALYERVTGEKKKPFCGMECIDCGDCGVKEHNKARTDTLKALNLKVNETKLHNVICGDVPWSIDDCEQASQITKAIISQLGDMLEEDKIIKEK